MTMINAQPTSLTKECPFCGVTNAEPQEQEEDGYRVWCCECGALGPPGNTEEESIAAWEQRKSK